jgi:hypothetical protein
VQVEELQGPGRVAGHVVTEDGQPVYQGLVREGIVSLGD